LESKDELKHRIDEASKYVPLERLALSSQCGFASTEEGNLLTADDQAAKLRLVAETAREMPIPGRGMCEAEKLRSGERYNEIAPSDSKDRALSGALGARLRDWFHSGVM
jgi:type II secretory pathway component GspD/PulD (secretin)